VKIRRNQKLKYITLKWNFHKGGEVLGKIPSMGKVWIFTGIAQSPSKTIENREINAAS